MTMGAWSAVVPRFFFARMASTTTLKRCWERTAACGSMSSGISPLSQTEVSCIYQGSAIPNTGVPGDIGGYTTERLLRAPCAGRFCPIASIGDLVHAGQVVATVDGQPVVAQIDGILRGLLQPEVPVKAVMKSGDIDPRC